MKELVDWLRAQLQEDRLTAQAVLADVEAGGYEVPITYPVTFRDGATEVRTFHPVYDPRERLRDVAVKLAMLDRWREPEELDADVSENVKTARRAEQSTLDGLILSLVTVYMDRPGYLEARERWHRAAGVVT